MELDFVIRAFRRYAWAIALCVALGVLPAVLLADGGPPTYRSLAVLLVAPPSETQFTVHVGGDPDRYVSGQLSVLRSQVMAERVAERLGDGSSARDVDSAVEVSNEAGTDVVIIAAATTDPQRSQAIANAYIHVYLESIRSQIEATRAPMLETLDAQIATLRQEIDAVDQAMVDVMVPFLENDPIPSLEQVAPGLISDKSILLTQLHDLQASRTQIRVGPRVASEVVQDATLPLDPEPSFRRTLLVIGVFGGGFVGALVAMVLARLSPNVVTDEQAEEILNHPVLGTLPTIRGLLESRRVLLRALPPEPSEFIEALCVRAEATNPGGGAPLTVVVAGTERGAGSTTLAATMARHFADGGARAVLIDSDRHDPELTRLFVRRPSPRRELPEAPKDASKEHRRRRARPGVPVLSDTGVRNLRVGPLASRLANDDPDQREEASSQRIRQLDVERFVNAIASEADVVVFDGGPLMASVTTVQLVRHCDAIILAMPRKQSIRGLEIVGAELDDRNVLPVWTPTTRRRVRRFMARLIPRRRAGDDRPDEVELAAPAGANTTPKSESAHEAGSIGGDRSDRPEPAIVEGGTGGS